MNDLNWVFLQGNLDADPSIRKLGDGRLFACMKVVSTRCWNSKLNGRRKRTSCVRVVTFERALIDKVIAKHALQGASVLVQGELRSSSRSCKCGSCLSTIEVHVGPGHTFQVSRSSPARMPPPDLVEAARSQSASGSSCTETSQPPGE